MRHCHPGSRTGPSEWRDSTNCRNSRYIEEPYKGKTWKDGASDGEIFRSICDGQSASMPVFKAQLHQEDDVWNLVNFIHSLWPESMRPGLQESNPPAAGKGK